MAKREAKLLLIVWAKFLTNMSYYQDYIQGLCSDSPEWVVNQICGELDSRDEQIAKEKRNTEVERISGQAVVSMFEEYKAAIVAYIGSSRVASALDEYRWNQEQKTP